MKRTLIILTTAWLPAAVVAQDYQISFTAEGENVENIDSIVVGNLNQDLLATLQWDDVLHLVGSSTGVGRLNPPGQKLGIYPNPFNEYTSIVFNNQKEGMVEMPYHEGDTLLIITSGVVPLTVKAIDDGNASMAGTGERIVTLSKKNGYTASIEEIADGTVYTATVTLNNPCTNLPEE